MDELTNNLLKYLLLIFSLVTNLFCNESPSVIIVGAGVSGIAAASMLLENNFTDLTILEAKDRIGGRIYTVPFGDNVVDLGAEWCHGVQNNIVFELASKYGVLESVEPQMYYFHSTGKPLDHAFMDELQEIFLNFYETPSGNVSTGDYIIEKYTEMMQDLYKSDPDKLEIAMEALELNLKYVMSVEATFSPFDSSATTDYEECKGNDLTWRDKGYKTILDILTHKYPNPEDQLPIDDKIVFNKEVVEINWNDEKQVQVTCADGSVYQADHVIVTVSLGVLKHSHETLFSPELPEEKITVIEDLGFGAIGKVLLHFPKSWWESNSFEAFLFVWNEDDKQNFLNSSEIDKSWLLDINAVLTEKDNPNVLLVMFAGPSIPQMELLPDDDLMNDIMSVILKFMGPDYDDIVYPDAMKRHGWYSDPHVLGTYSHVTIKSQQHGESPELILAKPLGDTKVLFAGEATNPIHYATVHGALESGQREAQRIMDLYCSCSCNCLWNK